MKRKTRRGKIIIERRKTREKKEKYQKRCRKTRKKEEESCGNDDK